MCQSAPKAACGGLTLAKAAAVAMDTDSNVLHPCAWRLVDVHPVLYGQSSIPDTLHCQPVMAGASAAGKLSRVLYPAQLVQSVAATSLV